MWLLRRSNLFLLALLVPFFAAAADAEVTVGGYLAARGVQVESPPSWLAGGFGRLAVGADAAGDEETFGLGLVHLTLDWQPTERFGAYVHGLARAEPDVAEGDAAGIVEAYLEGTFPARERDVLRLRLGHFFLPTSRENVETAWSSPYTITFSTLNTWIGEEMRLTGLGAQYELALGGIDHLLVGSSLFGGNDASGALLAWRGWSFGDRLSTFGEVVPLPPLPALGPEGGFEVQRDAGTKPFGSDLDGRLGWAGYVRYARPERAVLQATHFDNRGDRELHGGDYAWETELDVLGAEWRPTPGVVFLGELMRGSVGMGFPGRPYVQLDMEAAYLLASIRPGAFRVTVRYDTFENYDRDLYYPSVTDEHGTAWTLAFFWDKNASWRLGVELVDVDSTRPEAALAGFDAANDATAVTLELRYYLGF